MKGSIYTALLLVLAFLVIPEVVQSQTRRVYRSVNNKVQQDEAKTSTASQSPNATSSASQGERSVLQVDTRSNPSVTNNLYRERTETSGKAVPEPRVSGMPTVRRSVVSTEPKTEAPAAPTQNVASTPLQPAASVAQEPAHQVATAPAAPVARPVGSSAPATRQVTSSSSSYQQPSYQASRGYDDSDWKLFRSVRVSLLSESDRAIFRKYSIVLGSFRSYNNADFVRRTFNGLGERVIVVKNDAGIYYALLASFDDQTASVQKLESFTRQYATGNSKARRISKYGIPLDDLWILVND